MEYIKTSRMETYELDNQDEVLYVACLEILDNRWSHTGEENSYFCQIR